MSGRNSKSTNSAATSQQKMEGVKFSQPREISLALQDQNEASLVKSLISLRNQFTIRQDEHVSINDERLLLLQSWLEFVPAVRDVFSIWEKSGVRQQTLLSAVVSLLSVVLTLLSSHYSLQPLAAPVVNTLLSPQWLPKLNGYLSSTHRDLILFTLKLFNSLSAYGGGRERNIIQEGFAWESKTLTKLLHMRRKGGNESKNILAVPDIRSLFILFLLSFVDVSTASSVKSTFLEQRRELFVSVFKGLADDPYLLVRRVLEVCWSGIWSDQKIKRTLKVANFQESTISQIAKLYERRESEGPDAEDIPADLVHHYLLAICTTPGVGVCFKDRGWYPREANDATGEQVTNSTGSGRIYNRILGNILNGLKINEDLRQQELALRILRACPELVAGYWATSSLTLEPRLSSKWIANIAFLGTVISQPVPVAAFRISDDKELYHPSPPALTTIIENILPSANIKTHLSRGLQSPSALVQHFTALALTKFLTKYDSVLQAFRSVETALDEDDYGRWSGRRAELEGEMRRRAPEFQVVLAFAQQKGSEMLQQPGGGSSKNKAPQTNLARTALLLECAQRLLWLYYRLLPNLVSETRFDVGKLLHTTYVADSMSSSSATVGVVTLRHLHVLRLLRANDQFSCFTKTASHSNISILLKFYVSTRSLAIPSAILSLLRHALSGSLLFQHDAEEISLWLEALPQVLNDSRNNDQPSEENNTLISFLDDCMQRCHKTPYRYIEEQHALVVPSDKGMGSDSQYLDSIADHPETSPSPLLITALEQVYAKVQKQIDPTILSILVYLRQLFVRLASKVPSLALLHPLLNHLKSNLNLETYVLSQASTVLAIKEEVQGLTLDLDRIEQAAEVPEPTADEFLQQVTDGNLHGSDFLTKFVHSNDLVMANEECRDNLVETILQSAARLTAFKRSLFLINHRLLACVHRDYTQGNLLLLLSAIMDRAKHTLDQDDFLSLRQLMFQLTGVKNISSHVLIEKSRIGLASLLQQVLKEGDEDDKRLVMEHTSFWLRTIMDHDPEGDRGATATLWLRYMTSEQSWMFVDHLAQRTTISEDASLATVMDVLLVTLPGALLQPDSGQHARHLQQLTRLQSMLPHASALEPVISLAVNSQLPPIYPSSLKPWPSLITNAPSPFTRSKGRKWRRRPSHNEVDIHPFLASNSLTGYTRQIIVDLLYVQPTSRTQVRPWILQNATMCPVDHLASILLAVVDTMSQSQEQFVEEEKQHILSACRRLFQSVKKNDQPQEILSLSSSCLCEVTRSALLVRADIIKLILGECCSLKPGGLNLHLLNIVNNVHSISGSDASELVKVVLDHGCTWAVAALSQDYLSNYSHSMLEVLATLIEGFSDVKPHLIEPIVTVSIQNHLSDKNVMDFIRRVAQVVAQKPAIVNRQLQAVVQHPKLYELCGSNSRDLIPKENIVKLLHTLFYLHPNNTCQPTHITPLAPLYGGTLSTSDRRLLSISQLYESTRRSSAASLFKGSSPSGHSHGALTVETIQRLDPSHTFRACINFPQWRRLFGQDLDVCGVDDTMYDPVYVILLFAQMLAEQGSISALLWMQVFRTNAVSLLIRALSSNDEAIRRLALAQLAGLHRYLQDTDMVEQPHVLHILNLLKDQYKRNSPQDNPERLPAYTTLHLAHSLRGLFYPSQFTYPLTARYLLQRPELDVDDVPMLYATLYGADDQWKRDRAWMVRFLGDGMVGKVEWKVLRRRHTWDLVASHFQGTSDKMFRLGAFKLLANITCKPFTLTQLVLKSSLLVWMEAQLQDLKAGEELAWVKIIENIAALADAQKLDAATNGEWYLTLSRCLSAVLKSSTISRDALLQAFQIVLRLSIMHSTNPQLSGLISAGIAHLESIEQSLLVGILVKPATPPSHPPHTGQDLFRTSDYREVTWWWFGQCIEILWRTAMSLRDSSEHWDNLTYKLLIWRAFAGAENTPIGEWARKEAVRNLC